MALISGSNVVINEGSAGAWFTVTGSSFIADVDSGAEVVLETRRDSSDVAPKPLHLGLGNNTSGLVSGPCSVVVQSAAGRQYRFVCKRGAAAVAADQ
jgi:hypothetical protein